MKYFFLLLLSSSCDKYEQDVKQNLGNSINNRTSST